MKQARSLGRVLLLFAGSLTLQLGCGKRAISEGDTNTNWLTSCDENADCGEELSCLCGRCTVACADSADCPSRRAPECVSTDACTDATAVCVTDVMDFAETNDTSDVPVASGGGGAGQDPAPSGGMASGGMSSAPTPDAGDAMTDPLPPVADLSCASTYACALSETGDVECFGPGAPTPPADIVFTDVDAGLGDASPHTCGIQENREARCWGFTTEAMKQGGAFPVPGTKFLSISVGVDYSCGIYSLNSQVGCWGPGVPFNLNPPMFEPPAGVEFESISLHGYHACGVRKDDGTVACWGPESETLALPTDAQFSSVASGFGVTCGIRQSDDEVECVGEDWASAGVPAGVAFSAISVGASHACGIRQADGEVQCWGQNPDGQVDAPEGTQFSKLCTGASLSCGIRESDGQVECWGAL